MRSLTRFLKNEIVLTVAVILAIISSFVIPPDGGYLDYVDFRTLGLLFCLMAVIGGLQRLGLFRKIAMALLGKAGKNSTRVSLVLVLLAFFFSMLITNDVGLITFVPFTFTVLELLGEETLRRFAIPVVALETLAANLGSMLTPIGNPQNLYLYGKAGLGTLEFISLCLPYTILAGVTLVLWTVILGKRRGPEAQMGNGAAESREMQDGGAMLKTEQAGESGMASKKAGEDAAAPDRGIRNKVLLVIYGILFVLSLLTVARIVDWPVTFGVTLAAVALLDVKTLKKVDYCLLLTFVAFFVFIGNMGRVPAFSRFLAEAVNGREVIVAVLASQAISNVPAALLLSGFTENYRELILGVNFGGMGTLIASMASLISYKYVAKLMPERKGEYFKYFTVANIVFLAILLAGYFGLKSLSI